MTTTISLHDPISTAGAQNESFLRKDSSGRRPWSMQASSFSWTANRPLLKCLGYGGQGVVYLSERAGADGFILPVALKFFSPTPYLDDPSYDLAMGRIAQVSARVARIQQDQLVDIHNFVEHQRIRAIEMEWVDGYDLKLLLSNETLERIRENVDDDRWSYMSNVVISAGAEQPRLKPGVAVAILRDCLGALSALHQQQIVHSDVKPSNIMVKRTGSVKIIDIGSAFFCDDRPMEHICTPHYAASEVLEGAHPSPQSDLASLGYVLVEMLSGRRLFSADGRRSVLVASKKQLMNGLEMLLPREVVDNALLMQLIYHLIHPDLAIRFSSAVAAEERAASFHQQLVKGDLASEYETEIRSWIDAVC